MSMERYLGLDWAHLLTWQRQDGGREVLGEPKALQAFLALQQDAKRQGFTLEICSGHRSFERQCMLFNAKFLGKRPILDRNEQPILEPFADPVAKIRAILVFSAMPGFSRHHFGSDFDIYAPNLLPPGQSLQLTYHEYLPGAYFYELGQYLKENLSRFDFANPYQGTANATATNTTPSLPRASLAAVSLSRANLASDIKDATSATDLAASANSFSSPSFAPESHSSDSAEAATAHSLVSLALFPSFSDATEAVEDLEAKNAALQVGFEPWHISHLPSARPYLEEFDPMEAVDYVSQQDLPFAPWVREVMSYKQIQAMLRFDVK